MTTKTDVVEDYLRRLRSALKDLPRNRRREIVDDIEQHIEEARLREGASSVSEVRNVLDRLGEPDDIAADARERFGVKPTRAGFMEVAAIILLLIGGFFPPIVGWIVGVVLLWSSSVWNARDKIIGTVFVPGGLALPAFLVWAPAEVCSRVMENGEVIRDTCSDPSSLEQLLQMALLAFLVLAPIVSAIHLGRKASEARRSYQ